ncbi:hypothetical protein XA68_18173 [Ophiocordyceps unilateralis]|uniref:Uncharacterized protein n=1 Tax=Ophiocordyceps unilateralis TaxID=268505 RepID=A0A2A9PIA1_OPHUN|nr:hypothetical protein XA68_18173 [Ophiocordyceps unilateralis]
MFPILSSARSNSVHAPDGFQYPEKRSAQLSGSVQVDLPLPSPSAYRPPLSMSDSEAVQNDPVGEAAPRTVIAHIVDEDLIDYDSDDLPADDPSPKQTVKLTHSPSIALDPGKNDDFAHEATHDNINQSSPAGNFGDATTSRPQELGSSDDREPREHYEIDWEDDVSRDETDPNSTHREGPNPGQEDETENNLQDDPDAQEEELESTEAVPVAKTWLERLPTVWVQYKGEDYPLFSHSSDGFFSDDSILTQPMETVLDGFRAELSNEIDPDDDLVFQVDKLGLEFTEESCRYVLEIQMHEVLTMLDMLLDNQDPDSDSATERVLYTYLFTRPNTKRRYCNLRDKMYEGVRLDSVMYVFRPPSAGRVVETTRVSQNNQDLPDGYDNIGVDEANHGHDQQGENLGPDADCFDDTEGEAIRDEDAVDYDDEIDIDDGNDGRFEEADMAGDSGGPDAADIVEAAHEDEFETNPTGTADDEDLIDFMADDQNMESPKIGAAAPSGDNPGPGSINLVSGRDAVGGDASANDEDGDQRADVDGEGHDDAGRNDVQITSNVHGQLYEEDLIDYGTDDKLVVASSTDQHGEGNYVIRRDQGNKTIIHTAPVHDPEFDQDVEIYGLTEDADVEAGDQLQLGEDLDLATGLGEVLAGTDADDEAMADMGETYRTSQVQMDPSPGSAADELVGTQAETTLETALAVDLSGTGEVGDGLASAGLQSGPDTRGATDSSTTVKLRDKGDAHLTPDDAVAGMAHADSLQELHEIDWEDDAVTGNGGAGAPLNGLKRELPTEADEEDGSDVKRRASTSPPRLGRLRDLSAAAECRHCQEPRQVGASCVD